MLSTRRVNDWRLSSLDWEVEKDAGKRTGFVEKANVKPLFWNSSTGYWKDRVDPAPV
jgi:hypothetical protein